MQQVFDLLNNLGGQNMPHGQYPSQAQGQGQSVGAKQTSGMDLSSLLQGKGGLATGAVAGGLAGLLLGGKKSRKFAGKVLQVGGLAVAGGLAYKAWQNWQRNKAAGAQPAPAQSAPERFLPPGAEAQDTLAHHLIGAMIAAAKADGHISPEEQTRIESQLASLPMDEAARADVTAMLHNPPTVDKLVQYAATPEKAAEIYTASLLVIDADGAAEKGYLAMLAARLGLESDLVAQLHDQVDQVSG